MRKINFLKGVLGVAVAMLMTVGVSAQTTFVDDDYEVYDADVAAPTNVDYVTLKTGGTTMGYYAQPDPIYHPSYVAPGWSLTADFVWNWTVPTYPGATAPTLGGGTPANYVTITYPTLGDYEVRVAEQAPAAFGGCADATPTVMNVTVIAPPVATITTVDPAQACSNQPAATVALTFTEAVPAALAGYAFAINQTIENIDAAGTVIGAAILDADTLNFPTTIKLNTVNGLTGAASPYGWSFTTRDLDVLNGQRTRYTYTLVGASDAAADGLISAISQKSDYISGTVNTYTFGAKTTYVAIVNPAPSTGPIFYIPNDFNY